LSMVGWQEILLPPTGTNTTEAHILNEDTTYQSWVIQTGTVLHNIAPSSVV
jgi:hypothetical protein